MGRISLMVFKIEKYDLSPLDLLYRSSFRSSFNSPQSSQAQVILQSNPSVDLPNLIHNMGLHELGDLQLLEKLRSLILIYSGIRLGGDGIWAVIRVLSVAKVEYSMIESRF